MFQKDVADQVKHIEKLGLKHRRGLEKGTEHIQIQAMEPGTFIQIRIPGTASDNEESEKARSIFDGFPQEIKSALQSGSLDHVNEVLGRMDVAEAESLVGLLAEVSLPVVAGKFISVSSQSRFWAGCLDIDRDVIDATTEEGRRQVSNMERGDLA